MKYENNLLALRLHNNLSQSEIANILDMNVTVYARYERGERDLPMQIAKHIAYEFNSDLNYLGCYEQSLDYETINQNLDILAEEKEKQDEEAIEKYLKKQEHKRKIEN